jgi:hypothetical protein
MEFDLVFEIQKSYFSDLSSQMSLILLIQDIDIGR